MGEESGPQTHERRPWVSIHDSASQAGLYTWARRKHGITDAVQTLEQLGLPPIDQVGFVVKDLDASLALYGPLFGPFTRMDGSVSEATYRGKIENVELGG